MLLLQTTQLSKAYGVTTILKDISIQILEKEKVGLVGVNGAGKSTLLKLITGALSPDEGQILWAKNATFGYLAQNSGLESDLTIWDEMKSVYKHLHTIEDELRSLERKMGDPNVIKNDALFQKTADDYAALSTKFEQEGGYQSEANIRSILHGLGFSVFPLETPIHALSGGQKTRLALGKLLLIQPQLLILDEPTNYLDIDTLTWLEGWLKTYSGALLIVSHDRYFLDALVTKVIEIDRHQALTYKGNYSAYAAMKKQQQELQLEQYEEQQEEIARLEDFVQKNIVRASTTKRAQSRRKQLEKMELLEKPTTQNRTRFSFDIERQSGNDVLHVNNLSFGFDESPLFSNVSFSINRGERVALVGPNGIGKSTLLKLLTQQLSPTSGAIRYGSGVSIGYYDQEQTNMNPNNPVIEELWSAYPNKSETEIRTALGNFLFEGEEVYKLVRDLSGGEKARIALAKLMFQKANLIILDEPTNHLDIGSREVLEDALADYPGTIMFVSHDRYFLNKMSTRTLELSRDGIQSYLGNYDYLLQKKLENEASVNDGNKTETASTTKTKFIEDKEAQRKERSRQRRIEQLEKEIEELESAIAALEEMLCNPEVFQDHVKALECQNGIDANKEKLELLVDEWTSLSED